MYETIDILNNFFTQVNLSKVDKACDKYFELEIKIIYLCKFYSYSCK